MKPIQHFYLRTETEASFEVTAISHADVTQAFEDYVRPLAQRGWCLGEPGDSSYTVSGTLTPHFAKLTLFDEGVPVACIAVCLTPDSSTRLIHSMLAPAQAAPGNMVVPWVASRWLVDPLVIPPWLDGWTHRLVAAMIEAY